VKREDALKKKKEFRYTYRVGKSTAHRLMVVIVAHRRSGETRVGISVSKKQGNSVRRNRIKRRLREAVTPLIPLMRGGINVIIVARDGVAEAPYAELCEALQSTLERAGAIKRSRSS